MHLNESVKLTFALNAASPVLSAACECWVSVVRNSLFWFVSALMVSWHSNHHHNHHNHHHNHIIHCYHHQHHFLYHYHYYTGEQDFCTDRGALCGSSAPLKLWLQLRFDYDMMILRRIRLQRKWSKLRFAFDSTAIWLRHDYDEKFTCSSFACIEWKQANTTRRTRIVSLYHNCHRNYNMHLIRLRYDYDVSCTPASIRWHLTQYTTSNLSVQERQFQRL